MKENNTPKAEDILASKFNEPFADQWVYDNITDAMIEFAKIHVKVALECAAEKAKSNCGYREDEWGMNRAMFHRVDKKSILSAYPEELIE